MKNRNLISMILCILLLIAGRINAQQQTGKYLQKSYYCKSNV